MSSFPGKYSIPERIQHFNFLDLSCFSSKGRNISQYTHVDYINIVTQSGNGMAKTIVLGMAGCPSPVI